LACAVNRLSRLVEAEWTQCNRPATLAPVSSKCATDAAASRSHDLHKPAQPGRAFGHHRGQRAGGHARAEHVGQQLRGPVDGQVLVDAEVHTSARTPGP
jgi:hypothetical protein